MGVKMKRYIFLFLCISSFSVFSASERAIWMQSTNVLNQYQLSLSSQGIIQNNGVNSTPYGLAKLQGQEGNKKHTRYNLTYKGTPIWGRQLIVHQQKNRSFRLTGAIVNQIEQDIPDNQPLLTKSEATSLILSHVATPIKAKEIQKIIYIDPKQVAHNAYLLSFYTQDIHKGLTNPHFIINAVDASVLNEWDEAKTLTEGQGPGGNAIALPYREGAFQYGDALPNLPSLGRFPMDHWSFWCYMQTPDYRVINLRNHEIEEQNLPYIFPIYDSEEYTYNLMADYGYCWPSTSTYDNQNDGGYSPINEAYSPNNDAMYFVNQTLELYRSFGVENPLGDKDLPLRVYTHIGGFDNAFALPTFYFKNSKEILAHQQIVLSNGLSYFTALTQSVIAHELSHNFTALNSNLIYDKQSGGMNEAFSDMAALALMDRIHDKYPFYWDGKDWTLGREATKNGRPLRYIEHPALDGHSIENAKDYTDSLDVHYSSGVFNRAFYLLAHQPGWSVSNAFQVMMEANQNYWVPNSSFNEAACGVIQSALDNHFDATAVINSFAEVGVVCAR